MMHVSSVPPVGTISIVAAAMVRGGTTPDPSKGVPCMNVNSMKQFSGSQIKFED